MRKSLKIAYFDCFSGISGDMCLGALVDAGVPLKTIEKGLKKLHLKGFYLSEKRVRRSGLAATKVNVIKQPAAGSRKIEVKIWKDIKDIIKNSALSDEIKQKGFEIFKRLFEAEAKVHGKSIDKTHLHELGSIDCLVDVFGSLIGLSELGVREVYASAINLGSGIVKTAHGLLPVPSPAAAEILKDTPVYSSDIPFELTTPTGAAILKSVSSEFGSMPLFIPEKIGIGAGGKDIKNRPNILRVLIGNLSSLPLNKGEIGEFSNETISVIETNIDDMNPQIYEYLIEKLLTEGALDVFMTNVIMKKSRPGIKLSVLCDKKQMNNLINLIFRETTTIGVRYYETARITMDRLFKDKKTKYGNVRFKIARFDNFISKSAPEYESCKKIAKNTGISLQEIIEEVKKGE